MDASLDRDLILRTRRGETDAFGELVGRYQAAVFNVCYRLMGERREAEDMAQETFVRALRSLAQWDPERPFMPWLLAIAGNRCRSCMAVRMRRPTSTPLVEQLPDREPDAAPARQLAEEVNLALEEIRPEYREAFLLFHEQELSYAEIGAELYISPRTVARHLQSIYAKLSLDSRAEAAAYAYAHGIV